MGNDIGDIDGMEFGVKLPGFKQVLRMMTGKQTVGLGGIDFLPLTSMTDVAEKAADFILVRVITDHGKHETIFCLNKIFWQIGEICLSHCLLIRLLFRL